MSLVNPFIDLHACDSTCFAEGVSETYCTDCGAVISTAPIPKKDHTPDTRVTKEASCTESGQQEEYCTTCGTVINTVTIPAAAHKLDNRVAREATYTEEGLTETYCTVCGKVFGTTSIPKKACCHEHTHIINEVDNDCRGIGYDILKCDDCGEEFRRDLPGNERHCWQFAEKQYSFNTYRGCWVSHSLYACKYHPEVTYLNPDMEIYWDYDDPDVPPPHD